MEDDRRCAIRWQITLPVRYRGITRQREGFCRTHDLSTLGAKLAMVERCNPGDHLNMILDIPNSTRGSLCVEADVVWQKQAWELNEECKYMTGVAFRKIRDCHKKDILNYLSSSFPELRVQRWWDGVK